MIFDGSTIYAALVKMLRKGWNLSLVRRPNVPPSFRLIRGKEKIELSQFLAAKYFGFSQNTCGGFAAKTFEDARETENFLDFRKCNMYLPGMSLEHRNDLRYEVKPSPLHDGEKHIHITFLDVPTQYTEVVQYEPELDQMLQTPKYCGLWPGAGERANVSVNNDTWVRLSKFVAIYKAYFDLNYRGTKNGLENFIKDFKSIKDSLPKNIDADHINCNKHLNLFDNLMLVDRDLNKRKRDYVNWFVGEYGVHPIVNDAGEILFAYQTMSIATGQPAKRYYKCRTFVDFVDWIRVYLGKDRLTEKLQIRYNPLYDEQTVLLTPAGMIAAGISTKEVANENVVGLEEHIRWRDELLALPDEAYKIYEAQERRGLDYTVNLVLDMLGIKK